MRVFQYKILYLDNKINKRIGIELIKLTNWQDLWTFLIETRSGGMLSRR